VHTLLLSSRRVSPPCSIDVSPDNVVERHVSSAYEICLNCSRISQRGVVLPGKHGGRWRALPAVRVSLWVPLFAVLGGMMALGGVALALWCRARS
jgi:hypothetical protein